MYNLTDLLNRDKMSQYLPTTAYDEDRQLFYSEIDDTAGFIVEAQPIHFAGRGFYQSMSAFLKEKWPKKALAQFVLYGDPNLDPIIQPFRELRGDPFSVDIYANPTRRFLYDWSHSYADFLEGKKLTGIHPNEAPVPFRNFRFFCCVKIPCTIDTFVSGSSDLDRLVENREDLFAGFKTCHITSFNMHPDRYLKTMYQLWNPDHPTPAYYQPSKDQLEMDGRPFITWDKSKVLSDQIIEPDTIIARNARYLTVDKWKVTTKTLMSLPNEVQPIDFNLFAGDLHRANKKQILCPFLLNLVVSLDPVDHMITREGNLIMGQHAPLPGLAPRVNKRKEELLKGNHIINSGGSFLKGMVTLSLMSRNKKRLDEASSTVDAIWKQRGYRLQTEGCMHLPLYMFSQPFGANLEVFNKINRAFPAPADSFSHLVPIQADNNPSAFSDVQPVFLLISRRGQIIGHDLRDSPRDYNAVVLAPSGSGKSFFVNDLVVTNYSRGGINYIIDIGRSYEKLGNTLGGQSIEFTPKSNISLNLFSLITPPIWLSTERTDEEEDGSEDVDLKKTRRETCETILHQMVSPHEQISATEKALLGNILGECYDDLALEWQKKELARHTILGSVRSLLDKFKENRSFLDAEYCKIINMDDKSLLPAEAHMLPREESEFDNEESLYTEYDPRAEITTDHTLSGWVRALSRYAVNGKVSVAFFQKQIEAFGQLVFDLLDSEESFSKVAQFGYERLYKLFNGFLMNMERENSFTIYKMITKLRKLQAEYNASQTNDITPSSLAQRLMPFSSKGKYADWFKGDFNINFDNSMVVLELEELAQFDDLKQIVMILVLSSVEHAIYLTKDRSIPKMVIMDEAWDLLVGENTSAFIEKAYRRFRKYGASIITITQSIFDLVDKNKSVGQAVLNNSAWKFFLGPTDAEVSRASDEKIFPVNEIEKQLMISAHTVPGAYSEIAYRDPYDMLRLGRLHVDPKTILLFTTHPLEVQLIDSIRLGLKVEAWEAISIAVNYVELIHKTKNLNIVMEKVLHEHNRKGIDLIHSEEELVFN